MEEISNKEYLKIANSLEQHHAIFYKFFQLGKPIFTNKIPTACVQFNREGGYVSFMFNLEFWNKLDDYTRKFIICHEMLHVILNHGIRIKDCKNLQIANQALDIVVNHSLIKKFKFNRKLLVDDWGKKGCFVDTVFKNEVVPDDKFYEWYYNKFEKVENEGGSGGEVMDDHSNLPDELLQQVMKQLDKELEAEEKKDLKELIEKYFEKPEDKDPEGEGSDVGGKQAGTGVGGIWHFHEVLKVKKNPKWESIIQKWVKKRLILSEKEKPNWIRQNRRYNSLPSNIFLPTDYEIEHLNKDKSKIGIHCYLDVSGSTIHLKDRFFKCLHSIPHGKDDPFELRAFIFDTSVTELDLKKNSKLEMGGGTNFGIIEKNIQKVSNGKYPEVCFIITDGYGTQVKPEFPNRWFWFLSENYTDYIPKESKMFMLKDFE